MVDAETDHPHCLNLTVNRRGLCLLSLQLSPCSSMTRFDSSRSVICAQRVLNVYFRERSASLMNFLTVYETSELQGDAGSNGIGTRRRSTLNRCRRQRRLIQCSWAFRDGCNENRSGRSAHYTDRSFTLLHEVSAFKHNNNIGVDAVASVASMKGWFENQFVTNKDLYVNGS